MKISKLGILAFFLGSLKKKRDDHFLGVLVPTPAFSSAIRPVWMWRGTPLDTRLSMWRMKMQQCQSQDQVVESEFAVAPTLDLEGTIAPE